MRLIIVTAVDQGTESRDHLDHCYIKVLSETVGSQIGTAHLIHREQEACRSGYQQFRTEL